MKNNVIAGGLFFCALAANIAAEDFFDSAVLASDYRDNLQIFLKNPTEKPIEIKEVFIDGRDLNALVKDGQDLKHHQTRKGVARWYDVLPNPVLPGEWAAVRVRFGDRQEVGQKIKIRLVTADNQALEGELAVNAAPPITFASYSFAPDYKNLLVYLTGQDKTRIRQVLVNGKDLTAASSIRELATRAGKYFLVSLAGAAPFERGKYKAVKVVTDTGFSVGLLRVIEPYFPVGVYCFTDNRKNTKGHWDPEMRPPPEEWFRDLREHHVNAACYGGMNMSSAKYQASAPHMFDAFPAGHYRQYGIRLIEDAWWQVPLIEKYRSDPIMLAWSIADEPGAHNCKPQDQLVSVLNTTYRKYDPLHPSCLVFCDPAYFEEYNFVDIVMHDCYPLTAEPVDLMGREIEQCRQVSAPKPVWFVAQAFGPGSPGRYPGPDEERFMIYEALAHGAKGILYFLYGAIPEPCYGIGLPTQHIPEAKTLWESMKTLNLELNLLGGLLTKGQVVPLAGADKEKVEVAAIWCGPATIVVLALNRDYDYNAKGFTIRPHAQVSVTVALPAWLDVRDVFSVDGQGPAGLEFKVAGRQLGLELDSLQVSKAIVITADKSLRQGVAGEYQRLQQAAKK